MTKTRMLKKAASLLLAMALCCGAVFALPTAAKAAVGIDDPAATGGFVPAKGSTVYFGHYPQTLIGDTQPATGLEGVDWAKATARKTGDGFVNGTTYYFKIEPIAWRVLDNGGGQLLLITEKIIEQQRYHETNVSMTWENSNVRAWLNTASPGGSYPAGTFLSTAFTPAEQGAIADTAVDNPSNPDHGTSGGAGTTDKLFLLSIQEATTDTYTFNYFADDAARAATRTAYVDSQTGNSQSWWLRSPGDFDSFAALVGTGGDVSTTGVDVNIDNGIRPALRINLNSVLFTSDASGASAKSAATAGSPTLQQAAAPTVPVKLKLTVADSTNLALSTSATAVSGKSGGTVSIPYSSAQAGAGRSVSVLVCNSTTGKPLFYGRPVDCATTGGNGTASITLPAAASLPEGSYTLKIFNEQVNGDGWTDCVSTPASLTLTVDNTAPGLTAGTVSRTSGTAATAAFTSSEAGTWYYLVQDATATPPDAAAVKAAGNSGSMAASNSIGLGFAAGTKVAYIVGEDAVGNQSAVLALPIPAYYAATTGQDATLSYTGLLEDVDGITFDGAAVTATPNYAAIDGATNETELTLGGAALGKAVRSGANVTVTLYAAYLDTLPNGAYNLMVSFGGSSSTTTVNINRSTGTPATTTQDAGPGSPQTGDSSNLPLWALCGTAALAGLVLCGVALRKRIGRKAG